jgi:hypothetical protein
MIITQERLILSALDWTLYGPWNEICNQLDEEEQATAPAANPVPEPASCEEKQPSPPPPPPLLEQSPCSPTFGPCVPVLEAS